jgi:hypothetical protein
MSLHVEMILVPDLSDLEFQLKSEDAHECSPLDSPPIPPRLGHDGRGHFG